MVLKAESNAGSNQTGANQAGAKAWSGAVLHTAQGFGAQGLPVVAGQVPPGLRGTLYRNGPGRLERGDGLRPTGGHRRVGHWFDGDGAILAVKFAAAGVTATYRYVETAGYLAEEQAGRFLYGGYGSHGSDSWVQRWRSLKNAANTSVLALDDRLLALWEGGLPHGLDLQTLETRGLDPLGGLSPQASYSAHPKRDGRTGEIFNFGVAFGRETILHLYRSDRTGQVQQRGQVKLAGIPLLHDFVLAGRYLIFCIPPVQLNLPPVLLKLKTFSEGMQWQPQLGTEIVVCDRESLALVARWRVEPWFQWHFGNGAELADGTVVLDVVRYEDFATNEFLREVATGRVQTVAGARLWRLRLDVARSRVLEAFPLVDRHCEFPVVAPQCVGQPWGETFVNVHRSGVDETMGELFGAIARVDGETGDLTIADCGENRYPTEPIYAPDRENPERGWVLTVVFDGDRGCSEVWVYGAERLAEGPICRLGLPEVIPPSFHGTWQGV
ncbi:carotenoid oxygenase family protein [Alkalinema sp. FACHB-956]|nr:carotenoid oxygenase family protein [Alkalinema sp. FACHB-956]